MEIKEENSVNEEEKSPILVEYIKDRIYNKNKNFLMIFVGSTGSGKSYGALKLAEILDKDFNINYCCFKAKEFMNVINSLIERTEKGEVIKGRVILWDEFGVEHNAREFMTISNRVINYFFQTSRHLNLIVIMTVPLLSFIDSATRKLVHGIAEMQGINSRTKTATVKVKMLQTNVLTGKEYPKYLRYRKKGKNLVAKRLSFHLPSKELLQAYEKKKKEFTTQLNKDIMTRLLKEETKEVRKFKELTPNQKILVNLLSKHGTKEVADLLKINRSTLYKEMEQLNKKGIYFNAVWRDNRVICFKIEGLSSESSYDVDQPIVQP